MKKYLIIILVLICFSCEKKYKYSVLEYHPNDTSVTYYTNDINFENKFCISFLPLAADSNFYHYYDKFDTVNLCTDYIIDTIK